MTRLICFGDIHGNFIALDRVLAELETMEYDHLVCLGDVAATGPQPKEVIQRLKTVDALFILGNADAYLLEPTQQKIENEDYQRINDIDYWAANQLDDTDRQFIRTFSYRELLKIHDTQLLAYHGSPGSYDEVLNITTPDKRYEELIRSVGQGIFIGGHTHQQMYLPKQASVFLNTGSVGLPYETHGDQAINPSRAEFMSIEILPDDRTVIEFHRVKYDVADIKAAIEESEMPHTDWMMGEWTQA